MSRTGEALESAVAEQAGHVEVRGFTGADVLEALGLLLRVRHLQADEVRVKRQDLVSLLMASQVSLTPPATLAQAQRLAAARDALLATPILTYATLQTLRGDPAESTTRTWVARARARHAIFTVTHLGRTLVPAFQLDREGKPRPELQPLLKILGAAGIDGWSAWVWLTTPSSYLSGQVPESVAATSPGRAERAARRFSTAPVA